ncbi:MAG: carbonic anhydrase [Armatimonadetes bacterium]|nr:carbonic anhydrase [Armatimonadota bacterium]
MKEISTCARANESLEKLREGYIRYFSNQAVGPNRTPERRDEIAEIQDPHTVMVTCADSRMIPELIFDQGFGDIFTIRVAGNVLDRVATAGIEFASAVLGTPLLVVLGHHRCAAVERAVTTYAGTAPASTANIDALVEEIRPSVEATCDLGGDHLDNTIRHNVDRVIEKMFDQSPLLADRVRSGELGVVSAIFDMATGELELGRWHTPE